LNDKNEAVDAEGNKTHNNNNTITNHVDKRENETESAPTNKQREKKGEKKRRRRKNKLTRHEVRQFHLTWPRPPAPRGRGARGGRQRCQASTLFSRFAQETKRRAAANKNELKLKAKGKKNRGQKQRTLLVFGPETPFFLFFFEKDQKTRRENIQIFEFGGGLGRVTGNR
jgi:hypothetical protein